jgi:hypothetical protein
MAVRVPALRAGRLLPSERFLLPRAIVWLEGLGQLKRVPLKRIKESLVLSLKGLDAKTK